MDVFERFAAFASTLDKGERKVMATIVESLMEPAIQMTPDQSVELERRLSESEPEFASPEEVNAVFGRALPH